MKSLAKRLLLSNATGRLAYGRAHEWRFEREYRKRRERYASVTSGLDVTEAVARARAAVLKRGYTTPVRPPDDVHTFAFLPSNWPHQEQIARALASRGHLTRFDYAARGFKLSSLRGRRVDAEVARREIETSMLEAFRIAHRLRPVDVFFSYAVGWDLRPEGLQRLKDEFGVPTVNLSLDDKNWWDEIERGDPSGGLRHIAPLFDLAWTSARVVLPWYAAEGGQAVFMPEGVNTDWFHPMDVPQDIPVGFVGSNFGHRTRLIDTLRRAGFAVTARGFGWPEGPLSDEDMVTFFNRCRINLGLGDMHYSRVLTNLKGRDFEVPAVGRGVYLTAFNSDLAESFDIGRELLCYRGEDELIELLRYHLARPDESAAIARLGRQRCIDSHQWSQRLQALWQLLGIVREGDLTPSGEGSARLRAVSSGRPWH